MIPLGWADCVSKGFGSTTGGPGAPPNAWAGAPPPPPPQQPLPYPGEDDLTAPTDRVLLREQVECILVHQ